MKINFYHENFQLWNFQQFHENFELRKFGAMRYFGYQCMTYINCIMVCTPKPLQGVGHHIYSHHYSYSTFSPSQPASYTCTADLSTINTYTWLSQYCGYYQCSVHVRWVVPWYMVCMYTYQPQHVCTAIS